MSYAYQPDEDWQPIVVVAYRAPIGRAFGSLSTVAAEDLLAPIIRRILAETGIAPDTIDDVLVGNAAGGGGNIGRLAALNAGLPIAVPGVAIDRQCGSGLEAIILAARLIQAKAGACFLAGGVESVSTAPWRVERPKSTGALPRFYGRARFSPEAIGDPEMGIAAEHVARQFGISRRSRMNSRSAATASPSQRPKRASSGPRSSRSSPPMAWWSETNARVHRHRSRRSKS